MAIVFWDAAGYHYKEGGNKHRAIEAYTRALKLDPKNEGIKKVIAELREKNV